MSMTRQEVLRALADGKEVQCRSFEGDSWRPPFQIPVGGPWTDSNWRLKPTPVPPGDLTYEEAVELTKQGVPLQQYLGDDEWTCCDKDHEHRRRGIAYRRKPTPRMVPLEAKDVPIGSWIKWGKGEFVCAVIAIHPDGVTVCPGLGSAMFKTFQELFGGGYGKITKDGGKTWAKCEKEAAS